jgi:hypothetical protein
MALGRHRITALGIIFDCYGWFSYLAKKLQSAPGSSLIFAMGKKGKSRWHCHHADFLPNDFLVVFFFAIDSAMSTRS